MFVVESWNPYVGWFMGYISIFASIKAPMFNQFSLFWIALRVVHSMVRMRFARLFPPTWAGWSPPWSKIPILGLRIGSGAGLPKSSLSISISCLGGSSRLATGTDLFGFFMRKQTRFLKIFWGYCGDIMGNWKIMRDITNLIWCLVPIYGNSSLRKCNQPVDLGHSPSWSILRQNPYSDDIWPFSFWDPQNSSNSTISRCFIQQDRRSECLIPFSSSKCASNPSSSWLQPN